MSLIAWWPLSGNTNNYGTMGNQLKATNSNITYVDGKIGKAMHTGSLNLTADQWKKIIGNTISIAMWVYTRDDGTYSAGTPFFGYGGMNKPNNRKFTMFHYNTKTTLHCSWQHDDQSGSDPSNQIYWGCSYKDFFELNKWVHLCIVQDAATETITVYKNGKHYSTTKVDGLASFNIKEAAAAPVRNSIDYQHTGDIRIYDHALSQAEVSEISKALSIHYTFDDVLAEPTINIDSCKNAMKIRSLTGLSPGAATVTFGNYYGYECFEIHLKQEEFTKWTGCYLNINPLSYGAKIGDTVTRSMWLYVPSGQTTPKHFTESIEGNSSGKSYVNYDFNKCDTWQRVSLTGTITDDKTNHFLHYFTASNVGDPAIDFKCYIRDFQMEIKDHTTWYTSNERKNNLFNEAGYVQPDTTETKNVSILAEPAVGSRALRCNETAIVTPLVADIDQGVTISCWVKTPEYPSTNQVVFADTNSKIAFGFYGANAAIVSCASKSEKIISNFKGLWEKKSATEWQHLVITRNTGGTLTCWLNGKKIDQSAETSTNNWSQNKEALIIGCRYNGSYGPYCSCYIDDFRVYQTLLSDDDIIDLYKTKGYISNCGDMVCNEFVQEENEFLLNENSEAIAKNFVEHIPNGYEFIEYIANDDNKQYIDTGYYWHNEKATILADLEVTSNSGNQSLFGNEEVVGAGNSRYFAHIFHGKNGSFSNYIGKSAVGVTSIPLNTRMKVEYAAHGDNTFSIKTRKVATGETTTYNGTYSGSILTRQNTITNNGVTNLGHIFIFANHNSASGSGAIQQVGGMKLYGFIMIDNNECVRDFRPCRRIKDSVVGLFDMIEGKFYTTPVSAFVAGEVVSTDTSFQVFSDSTVYANQLIEI